MKIFKGILTFAAVIVISFFLFFPAAGEDLDGKALSEDYGSEIYSSLDKETKEILSSFGINGLDFDSVFNLSFKESLKAIGNMFRSSVTDAAPYFFKMLAMLITMVIISDLKPSKSGERDIIGDIFTMITVIMTASFVSEALTQMAGAFKITGDFLLTLAPIITALLSVSGNVTASVLYNSVNVALAQIISAVSSEILIPLTGVYFSFVISLNMNDSFKSDRLIRSVNRALTGVFTAISTAFTFILSVKNVLAKDLDGVLYKSGKYVISSLIPVVGSNISAILNSIIGSVDLIKSTVAVFGVICVATINIPVVIKLTVCYVGLSIIGFISDFFSAGSASSVARGFAGGIKLLTALVLFEVVLVLISTGLAVTIKGAT